MDDLNDDELFDNPLDDDFDDDLDELFHEPNPNDQAVVVERRDSLFDLLNDDFSNIQIDKTPIVVETQDSNQPREEIEASGVYEDEFEEEESEVVEKAQIPNRSVHQEKKITTVRRGSTSNIKTIGISLTQKHLGTKGLFGQALKKTLEKTNHTNTSKRGAISRSKIDSLSRPKTSKARRAFANDDDELNCTFKPKVKRKTKSEYDTSSTGGFLARTEALERTRRKKLEYTRGEEEYETRLDKKECPDCGVVQSYAEFRDRKKKCPACNVEFRPRQTWGDIRNGFMKRMQQGHEKKQEKMNQLRTQITRQEKQSIVKKSSRQKYYDKCLGKSRAVEDDVEEFNFD